MMAATFLGKLQRLGVEVSAAGGRLRYRAPRGTVTPQLRDELAAHKVAILSLLQNGAVRAEESERRPLSPAQERLWFMDLLVPGIPLYNEAVGLRLDGALNAPALAQSLNELVRRHEALRTSFETVDGEPYQRVLKAALLKVGAFDLTRLAEGDRADKARETASGHARRPFSLARPPLIRAGLISQGLDAHTLVLSLHHIVCDGWSRGVLARELSRLYESYIRGESPTLPRMEVQYSDFTTWQRGRIDRGELDHEMEYWKGSFGRTLPAMDLPIDRPRPAVPKYRGSSCEVQLDVETSKGVRSLSRTHGVTPTTTLLAAFQVLLGRYCGQDEVIVGTVAASRARAELENVVGLIVNTLPIRADLGGNPTFKETIGRVKKAAVGAYKYQELPYERLVAELSGQRHGDRRELIDVMFVMEQGLTGHFELSGVTVREERIETGTAKYDLMMFIEEKGQRFQGRIEYNSDVFDSAKIKRMAESLRLLVQAAVADPNRRIMDLPLASEAETHVLSKGWNDTSVTFRGHKSINRMFDDQVDRAPDAIAVEFQDGHVSYRELQRRADLCAARLRGCGVEPGVIAGLCLDRTTEMAVGVLATLKAGGAYLPLDPSLPRARLRFMLKDAGSKVVLTQRHLRDVIQEYAGEIICLDSEALSDEGQPVGSGGCEATEDDPIYVIYTSGSTGKPKGASLPHRALLNLIRWHNSRLLTKSRTLQFASLGFDVSFYEMFAAWASGGTLCIAPEEARLDTSKLTGFLCERGIEKAILPVIVLQQLAEEQRFSKRQFASLREVITTGEQLQITRPIAELFAEAESCRLHNHYGPSESHVVTAYALGQDPEAWPTHPPIGTPIANTRAYLLDPYLNPVPPGTVAELYIAGVALARGYLSRPDMTAELFIPDPFGNEPGGRLYKTGDLARHREDGNIDFLGRVDHQVKIRGLRVELGEIESVLDQHPAVRQAVVVTRESAPGHKRLVAYVATDRRHKTTADELRSFLKERLPAHMMPTAYIVMDKLPVTSNGKVDRAALTLVSGQAQAEELVPARTPAEELVARIWRDVLEVDEIGINSNFFNLGGHSLLATQIILRLREIFRVEVPVRSLFEMPTVDGIVNVLSGIWGGREIVDEIAWTFLQVEQMSDQEANEILMQRGLG